MGDSQRKTQVMGLDKPIMYGMIEAQERKMKTVRFYDLMVDILENGTFTTEQISSEFTIELPEDFDLNYAFDMLSGKAGQDVCSFRYEYIS